MAYLARGLASRGHEVFAALAPGALLAAELDALPAGNIHTLPLRNALDIKSALRLGQIAREREVDLIHAHAARDYPLAAFAARRYPRARLVITRHVPFALSGLHRLALSNVSRVVCVSGGVARRLREQHIFDEEKIVVVPNGVEFARYDAALAGFDRDEYRRAALRTNARLVVGTVGELSDTKGQDVFLRAAAGVARRLADVDFFVVGEDNSHDGRTRRRLEEIVEEEHLRGRVHFRGHAPDLPRLLAALDIYVSASRAEAFGLATVEAAACGACVVVTGTDGSREIVTDGATGRLVPVGDAEALAAALVELLEDEGERARLSANASASVRERFSLGRIVEETEKVYRSVLP